MLEMHDHSQMGHPEVPAADTLAQVFHDIDKY